MIRNLFTFGMIAFELIALVPDARSAEGPPEQEPPAVMRSNEIYTQQLAELCQESIELTLAGRPLFDEKSVIVDYQRGVKLFKDSLNRFKTPTLDGISIISTQNSILADTANASQSEIAKLRASFNILNRKTQVDPKLATLKKSIDEKATNEINNSLAIINANFRRLYEAKNTELKWTKTQAGDFINIEVASKVKQPIASGALVYSRKALEGSNPEICTRDYVNMQFSVCSKLDLRTGKIATAIHEDPNKVPLTDNGKTKSLEKYLQDRHSDFVESNTYLLEMSCMNFYKKQNPAPSITNHREKQSVPEIPVIDSTEVTNLQPAIARSSNY